MMRRHVRTCRLRHLPYLRFPKARRQPVAMIILSLLPCHADPIRASDESEGPPAYEHTSPNTGNPGDAVDYLDVSIPRPASLFASASSTRRLSAPPGLTAPGSYSRHELATDPSPDVSGAINIELLEDALPVYHERRTTFGLPVTIVYPREATVSEQGSLHSMRSHLSPHSALSASGSAPAFNSNSEHPRGFTASSLRSLAHSQLPLLDRAPPRATQPRRGVSPALHYRATLCGSVTVAWSPRAVSAAGGCCAATREGDVDGDAEQRHDAHTGDRSEYG
ncbi:hypothetical protein BJV78DRAFT_371033 [Lactifluus subvellereus]|nr:hypothetical protein BJV78DRAFT_371033 [Lactifluus subvellereus]